MSRPPSKSYRDALLDTTVQKKDAMTRDARRLLSRTHPVFDKVSFTCGTLQVFLHFCQTHAPYITRGRETALLHETLFRKLTEFRALVAERIGSPCRCVGVGGGAPKHSYQKYAAAVDAQLRRYGRTLPGSLLAVYIELGKRLAVGGGNDVVKHIMSFVTPLPL
jgi:hypothetical protein